MQTLSVSSTQTVVFPSIAPHAWLDGRTGWVRNRALHGHPFAVAVQLAGGRPPSAIHRYTSAPTDRAVCRLHERVLTRRIASVSGNPSQEGQGLTPAQLKGAQAIVVKGVQTADGNSLSAHSRASASARSGPSLMK